MTPDDDHSIVNSPLDDRTADALLRGVPVEGEPELTAFMSAIKRGETAAPEPTAALAAMLEGGVVPTLVPIRSTTWTRSRTWTRTHHRTAVGLGVFLASFGGLVGAASANVLPAAAQNAVADAIEAVTPLHVPHANPTPTHPVTPDSTTPPGTGATPFPQPAPQATDKVDGALDHDGKGPQATPTSHPTHVPQSGKPHPSPTRGGKPSDRPSPHSTKAPDDQGGDRVGGSGGSGGSGGDQH